MNMPQWIEPWYGFDLDGTIADDANMNDACEIGPPIQKMIDRIKRLRSDGQVVKIVTARVDGNISLKNKDNASMIEAVTDLPKIINDIEQWCLKHIGEILPVTDAKDCGMKILFDDKVIRVNKNTGEICQGCRGYLNNRVEQSHERIAQLGEYHELEEIGGREISIVYRGISTDTSVVFALKSLRSKWLDDITVVKQFDIECEIASKIAYSFYSNIVLPIEIRNLNDRTWIIMEYVTGATNVESKIHAGKRYSIEETVALLKPIAHDLDIIHSRGIYHCDIKPINILLQYGRIPLLSDFGIGQLKDSSTYFDVNKFWGTVKDYIAPEIKSGSRATSRSDQYMLGVTALEMITGSRKMKTLPNLTMIEVLQENPDSRFESCLDFIQALEKESQVLV